MAKTIGDLSSRRPGKMLIWLTGITVFVLECAAGYYYNIYVGYYHGDGISRVANAFYVLYSREPHLGAIGFVWNPLPSMVDLVFLLFYRWIPAMATKGIAGLLMSAIFASLTAAVLTRAFIQRNLPYWCAVLFPLLFSLNPMIFLFGFNGLSDAPFIFFIIMSIIGFLNWLDGKQLGDLVAAGFALALAFWCRYEAVPFGFSMFLGCVIATMWFQRDIIHPDEGHFHYKWSRTEGMLSVIVPPLLYSVIVWILLNWIIMNNPLYFLNGEYSNTTQVQSQLSNTIYWGMIHSPIKASLFAFKKVLVFSGVLISILILRLFNRRLVQWDTLILLGMFFSIPMLQIIMLTSGTTMAWLRYFMYVLPISVAWLPYELSKLKRKWQIVIPLIAMLVSFGLLSYAITQPLIAPDENTFLKNSFGNHDGKYYDWQQDIEIAKYLDENYPGKIILVDSSSAFFIILQSKFPKDFYINSDKNFKNAISDPIKYNVDYVLIPKHNYPWGISVINQAYPNLYDHGADWVELVKEFGTDWRLYKVSKSTEGH
ncbi:glycosyltransferase family 39 protein [Desulfosporosinus sp. PR]|uniref:glycosyltransferase family 39 protein n=1 Tax=Candidatus Desulfosporosinus nitrosoreducens TaxID=3401928 RepID=UPI0027FB025E|nr:glycosyltransferase family 39 protein [Desulfosporosinus sp. PR]MDQ7095549.1 glycosyltransferase family 39 protein [Desulfosporosinus sp. PR]